MSVMKKRKKIDGKLWNYNVSFTRWDRSAALSHAAYLRNRGLLVRVLTDSTGDYNVYTRRKDR